MHENLPPNDQQNSPTTIKCALYADDLTIYLQGDASSLRAVMSILDDFYRLSGLKINVSKTKAVWIGSKCESNEVLCPDLTLEWDTEFDLLGIHFDNKLETMDNNFEGKLTEIEKTLNSWLYRHLTPFGKICIIKSLALSKLSHLALVIPSLSGQRLKVLNAMFFKFLWDNKPDKICRKDVIKPVKKGGLGMTKVDTFWDALKFSWY